MQLLLVSALDYVGTAYLHSGQGQYHPSDVFADSPPHSRTLLQMTWDEGPLKRGKGWVVRDVVEAEVGDVPYSRWRGNSPARWLSGGSGFQVGGSQETN